MASFMLSKATVYIELCFVLIVNKGRSDTEKRKCIRTMVDVGG